MYTVASTVTKGLLFGSSHWGVQPEEIIAAVKLSPEVLDDPDGRIPYDTHIRVWEEIVLRVDDPDFGLHLAEHTPSQRFGLTVRAFLASATVKEALENYIRYSRVHNNAFDYKLNVSGDEAHLLLQVKQPPYILPRQVAECVIGIFWLSTRRIIGNGKIPLLRVGFQHSKPDDTSEHRRILGVEPEFGTASTEFVIPADLLESPGIEADDELLKQLEQQGQELLNRLPRADQFTNQLRAALYDLFATGAAVDVSAVATRIGIHRSELQQKLANNKFSLSQAADALKRDLAMLYLEDKSWTLGDIAFALGFRDASAFSRSFKRWTGKSPSSCR